MFYWNFRFFFILSFCQISAIVAFPYVMHGCNIVDEGVLDFCLSIIISPGVNKCNGVITSHCLIGSELYPRHLVHTILALLHSWVSC